MPTATAEQPNTDHTFNCGFMLRTGGNLPDKVFGMFGTKHDADESREDDSGNVIDAAELKSARAWAAQHNKHCALIELPFRFFAHLPATESEYADLYSKFLTTFDSTDAFLLYR